MRFGLRSLQACILLTSAAFAAFATPSNAGAGASAVQAAVAPAAQAGEKPVQEAMAPGGKTAHPPATGAVNTLAPVKRPPAAPSTNLAAPQSNAFFTVMPCRVFDTRLPADAP